MREKFFLDQLGVIYEVTTNHVSFVRQNVGLFGLRKSEIDRLYFAYNEPIGLEGMARLEILRNVIASGWTRIRCNKNSWEVNVNIINDFMMFKLSVWARYINKSKKALKNLDRFADVFIFSLHAGEVLRIRFNELSDIGKED